MACLAGDQTPRIDTDLGRLSVLQEVIQDLELLALRFGHFYQHRVGLVSLAFHGYGASP